MKWNEWINKNQSINEIEEKLFFFDFMGWLSVVDGMNGMEWNGCLPPS